MTRCRSCGAPILWAKTAKGKAIPLDPEPSQVGNIELDGQTARYVSPDMNALGRRYVSHFSTCPAASEHRRRKA